MPVPAPKARLVPLYLVSADDPEFVFHTQRLRELLVDEADLTDPLPLGAALPPADLDANTDVLNGIAYDRAQDRLFITGKFWPKLFQVRLKRVR